MDKEFTGTPHNRWHRHIGRKINAAVWPQSSAANGRKSKKKTTSGKTSGSSARK